MYDAIVVGVGGMGSATVYHLARSGCNVLGLELFGIAHAFGSSHGSTRIIRLAYSEGSEYVPLLRAAYRYWRELEEISGQSILQVTGSLDIGPEGSWTIEGSRHACRERGLAYEDLDGAEIDRRFPGYQLPDSLRGIYQPDGGYLRSEVAIAAYAATARALGAEIVTEAPVRLEFPILSLNPGLRQRCVAPDVWGRRVAGGGAAAIVEEAGRHAGRLTGGAPRRWGSIDSRCVNVTVPTPGHCLTPVRAVGTIHAWILVWRPQCSRPSINTAWAVTSEGEDSAGVKSNPDSGDRRP